MSFPPVAPGGFPSSGIFTSMSANKLDAYLQRATSQHNPDEVPGLNLERYVDALGNTFQFTDVTWDPVIRGFMFLTLTAGDTGYISKYHFLSAFPGSSTTIGPAADFSGGAAISNELVVIADRDVTGNILVGNNLLGFSLATTPPGVKIGQPVYAHDIDTWVVGAASGNRYYSIDGGDTWTMVDIGATNASPTSLQPATDGTRILLGNAGTGISSYTYSDDGIAWTAGTLPDPVDAIHFAWLELDPSTGTGVFVAVGRLASGDFVRTFLSIDGGATFVHQADRNVGGASPMQIGFVGNLLVMGLDDGRLMASDDLGVTYTEIGLSLQLVNGVAARTRILSGPFCPNMFVSFASDAVGTATYQQDVITSLRNRI